MRCGEYSASKEDRTAPQQIFNREGLPGNVVTYLKKKDNSVLTIGDVIGKIKPGAAVYKITNKALMERARKSYEGKSWEDEANQKKIGLIAEFKAALYEPALLTLTDDSGNRVSKHFQFPWNQR